MYHHFVLNLSSPAHVVAASGSDKQSYFHMSEGKQVNYLVVLQRGKPASQSERLLQFCNKLS